MNEDQEIKELILIEEQVKIAEEQLKTKEVSLRFQKWHLVAIWVGVFISLVNMCFNTLNLFLLIAKK